MKNKLFITAMFTLGLLLLCGCTNSLNISTYQYDDANMYTKGGSTISNTVENLEIDWISGSVSIETHEENTVLFSEVANKDLNDANTMYYYLEDTTLHIKFCRSGDYTLRNIEKDLTLYIPEELNLNEVKIESVSANLEFTEINTTNLEVDSVSGNINIKNCKISDEIEIDSVSGAIEITLDTKIKDIDIESISGAITITASTIETADVSATSGKVIISSDIELTDLKLDTISGNIKLILNEDSNFKLDFDSISGNFSSQLAMTIDNNMQITGNGSGDYDINTISGSLTIEKANN